MTEAEFQKQVTDLAELLGWSWVHFRPAQTAKGWRTPVSGPLGKGWPDLVLLRVRDRRLIFAELKAERGKATSDQAAVLAALDEFNGAWWRSTSAGAWSERLDLNVQVWRPADFDSIAEILR